MYSVKSAITMDHALWPCSFCQIPHHDGEHPFHWCLKSQDQTQIHCLTKVSNKKLVLCSDAGTTWRLPRAKGTHTHICPHPLTISLLPCCWGLWGATERHKCAGKRVKQLSSNSSERLGFTLLFVLPLGQLPEVHKRFLINSSNFPKAQGSSLYYATVIQSALESNLLTGGFDFSDVVAWEPACFSIQGPFPPAPFFNSGDINNVSFVNREFILIGLLKIEPGLYHQLMTAILGHLLRKETWKNISK